MVSLAHLLAAIGLIAPLMAGLIFGAQGARGESLPQVALLPMVVHSSESPEYLRAGLADMLASRLEQMGGVRVVRVDDPAHATSRLSRALATGRKLGTDFVLFGAFTRFGQGASLDVQCAATAAEVEEAPLREIFVYSGSIGEVIPDLDDLVGKVSRFVDRDFAPAPAKAGGEAPGPAPRPDSLEDLRRRVEALEEALGRPQSKARPAAVAAPTASARSEAALR
jgi:TolB-like protein